MLLLQKKNIGSIRRSRRKRVCHLDLLVEIKRGKRESIIQSIIIVLLIVRHSSKPGNNQMSVLPQLTRIHNRQMLLVSVLQHPRVTVIHVSIVESLVISLGNVRIRGSIIQIIRRPPAINNRVKFRIRTIIRMLRRAKMKRRQSGFSIFRPRRFQKGSP